MGYRNTLPITFFIWLALSAMPVIAQTRVPSPRSSDGRVTQPARRATTPARRQATGQIQRTPATPPAQRQANRNTRPTNSPRLVTRSEQTQPQSRRSMTAQTPPGFPLRPDQQRRVDQILKVWEVRTAKIKTHQCQFVRRNYDFVFGDRETPKTVDVGTIRYREPDKGLMRVDKVYEVTPDKKLEKQDVQFGEYWVCDGESIFAFDSRTKVLTETVLPPEMRGQSIGEGPLPFMFGAKSETMKSRYWIREVPPKDENKSGEYYLEAYPKRQQDAANVEKLLIVLAVQGDYLFPTSMLVFNRQGKVVYQFKEHRPNDSRHRVQGFLNSFVKPKKPRGWKKITEDWEGNAYQPAQE